MKRSEKVIKVCNWLILFWTFPEMEELKGLILIKNLLPLIYLTGRDGDA